MKRLHAIALVLGLSVGSATAQVVIDIEGAQRSAQPIAISPVQGDPGEKMDYIIASDLYKSGFFQPIPPDKFSNLSLSPNAIDYAQFKALGAEYIVLGRTLDNGGRAGQFILDQVDNQQVIFNEKITRDNARQVAHAVADLILERLTGVRGSFSTRIAYVLERRGKGKNRQYSLIVSDIDGANRQEIFSSTNPILSPAWSPNGREIAYMTYNNNYAQIVIQNVSGGGRRVLIQSETTSSSPSWAPNGSQLVVSRADGQGSTNIYLVDVGSGAQKRLTNSSSINTEPVFSPDGRYIYFTSDRAGNPQIYRMNSNGGDVKRAIVGSNYGSNSKLAPDGKNIVLTRQSGGGYQIGIYNLQSGRFQALTSGRLDEGASFSPNGQLIIYTATENGRTVLKMINLKGGVVQTLSDPSGYLRDPAWAP